MPINDARQRANKTYAERLKDSGHLRLTLWLSPQIRPLLAALAPKYGSARAAVEAGLRALSKEKTPLDD
jgi:hypothetical protein